MQCNVILTQLILCNVLISDPPRHQHKTQIGIKGLDFCNPLFSIVSFYLLLLPSIIHDPAPFICEHQLLSQPHALRLIPPPLFTPHLL